MRKVSFSFPDELVDLIDRLRGEESRNRFIRGLLDRAVRDYEEKELRRLTAEVYGDADFAREEERLAEEFAANAPEADL